MFKLCLSVSNALYLERGDLMCAILTKRVFLQRVVCIFFLFFYYWFLGRALKDSMRDMFNFLLAAAEHKETIV